MTEKLIRKKKMTKIVLRREHKQYVFVYTLQFLILLLKLKNFVRFVFYFFYRFYENMKLKIDK